MNNPIQGMLIGSTTMSISLVSVLEFGTTVLGFLGALIGFLSAVGHFYFWVSSRIREAKNQNRRKTDKVL